MTLKIVEAMAKIQECQTSVQHTRTQAVEASKALTMDRRLLNARGLSSAQLKQPAKGGVGVVGSAAASASAASDGTGYGMNTAFASRRFALCNRY